MTSTQFLPDTIPANQRKHFENPLPTPEGAEMSVIGAILIEPLRVTQQLREMGFKRGHFNSERNREVFIAAVKCIKKDGTVDLITLCANLNDKKLIQHAERCAQCVPSAGNIRIYAKIVMDACERRELMAVAGHIAFRLQEHGDPKDIRKGMSEWLAKQEQTQ